jgi:hypothetical protein
MYKIIFFALTFFFVQPSFAQTENNQETLNKDRVSSQIVDYNKTVNPRVDLVNTEDAEATEKVLIPFDKVIPNSLVADPADKVESNTKEKEYHSLNEVINPSPLEPKKED